MPYSQWIRGLSNSSTSTAFPSIVNTTTQPATVDAASAGSNYFFGTGGTGDLLLRFFGVGADDTTFDARLVGWTPMNGTGVNSSATPIWIPTRLVTFSLTLSTLVGVASATQIDTERDADTITATNAALLAASSDFLLYSPTTNTAHAMARVNSMLDFPYWSIYFDMTGATSGNFAYRWVS